MNIKIFCYIAFFGAMLVANFASGEDMDLNGFRGLEWGTKLAAVPGMQPNGQMNPDFVWYKRGGDKKSVGNAELFSISYLAYKGRLFRVDLQAIGPDERRLSEVIASTFGRGEAVRRPEELGPLWPQQMDGPVTGREMYFTKAGQTQICHIIGRNYMGTSMTTVSFIDIAKANELLEQEKQGSEAKPGDF